ncbi:Ger(x)C family spore germination protein [Paenibacillus sp. sgz500958]|uniref:Ger(x)C family spore germination protein n=1 Tax=Paenibacillus sp. sgz500958 TaxID=3242475 RepID=UPI0036D3DB1B
MLRRGLLLMMTTLLCLLLSGCWDWVEMNQSSMLTGIAIEPGKNGKFKLTLEVLNPTEAQRVQSGSGGPATLLYAMEGKSVSEVSSRMNEIVERRIIYSHIHMVIVDESIAREGLNQIIDVLQRSRFVREDVLLLIAKDSRASDVLKIMYPSGQYASWKLRMQNNHFYRSWGGTPKSTLYNYTNAILNVGREPVLAAISVQGDVKKSEKSKNVTSSSPKAIVKCAGSAVFKEDKLIGYISVPDTRLVNLISDEIKGTSFAVPVHSNQGIATIRMFPMHTAMKVTLKDGRPNVKLNIEGEGHVSSIDTDLPLDTAAGFRELEHIEANYLNEQVKAIIKRVQKELGVDIFGFGDYLNRHHYPQYKTVKKDWNAHFAEAKIEVSSRISISRSDLKTRRLKDGGD